MTRYHNHIFMTVAVLMIFALSCSEVLEPVYSTQVKIAQIGGCVSAANTRNSSMGDSSFFYEFKDMLKVEFWLSGNCCPDSDRFASDYRISNDTIFVTMADTAANLCRCICNYNIVAEFSNLAFDRYLFQVRREDWISRYIFYSEYVFRK
ncbi:MAG: hypothetical protein JW995_10155 [Melioribacteraceae bacterium]|nr:hypothetical protein [Melioribacteraceae bacterium]